MTDIEKAARRYCDARDQERAIITSLKRCERRDYTIVRGNPGAGELCSRNTESNGSADGVIADHWSNWCDSCQSNVPAVKELRRLRRSFAGLMSALRRAVRRAGKAS